MAAADSSESWWSCALRSLGMTSVCPSESGPMSRKAKTWSSSYTFQEGISPERILSKMVGWWLLMASYSIEHGTTIRLERSRQPRLHRPRTLLRPRSRGADRDRPRHDSGPGRGPSRGPLLWRGAALAGPPRTFPESAGAGHG